MPCRIRVSLLLLLACPMLDACGGEQPRAKSERWIGRTFLLDVPAISSTSWTKPSEVTVRELSNYAIPQLLFGVEAASGDDLVVTLAAAQEGTQDTCNPTTQLALNGAGFPNSTMKVDAVPMRILSKDLAQPGGAMATIHDATFTDILPGLTSTATSRLDAVLDFAELASFLWPGGSADAICEGSALAGDPCEICPFNGEPYCMTFEAVDIRTQEVVSPIKRISPSDVAASCSSRT
jgi:hypothetical protein